MTHPVRVRQISDPSTDRERFFCFRALTWPAPFVIFVQHLFQPVDFSILIAAAATPFSATVRVRSTVFLYMVAFAFVTASISISEWVFPFPSFTEIVLALVLGFARLRPRLARRRPSDPAPFFTLKNGPMPQEAGAVLNKSGARCVSAKSPLQFINRLHNSRCVTQTYHSMIPPRLKGDCEQLQVRRSTLALPGSKFMSPDADAPGSTFNITMRVSASIYQLTRVYTKLHNSHPTTSTSFNL
ncbi:hypothetical protein C8R47DRAFT_1327609 [Mycena vitilis]|nr:hypothetical protein C8R47DRAFT_1327609 [Mycena vitilis]